MVKKYFVFKITKTSKVDNLDCYSWEENMLDLEKKIAKFKNKNEDFCQIEILFLTKLLKNILLRTNY